MKSIRRFGSMQRKTLFGAALLLTAGCAAITPNPGVFDATGNSISTVIPDKTYNITPHLGLSVETILLGAAAYWIIDPLAPNWQTAQLDQGKDTVQIALRKKRFTGGGDGEAAQVFARHAAQLARERGYAGYAVLQYTEGIESTLPLAQRVALGVVQLKR